MRSCRSKASRHQDQQRWRLLAQRKHNPGYRRGRKQSSGSARRDTSGVQPITRRCCTRSNHLCTQCCPVRPNLNRLLMALSQGIVGTLAMQSITPSIGRANTRHLYWDMFWMCAAFAVDWYFLQGFAIRMNATPLQIGLLFSLRAAFLVVGSTLANYWRHPYKNPIPAMVLQIITYRALLNL